MMLKKVVTGALVVVILGTASVTSHAASGRLPSYGYTKTVVEDYVKIIQPTGDVVFENNILISVQALDNATVSFKIYQQDPVKTEDGKIEDLVLGDKTVKGTVVLGPEKVEQGENVKRYQKKLQLLPGKYVMVFDIKDKNGQKKKAVFKEFTVTKEEEVNKTLNNIQNVSALDNLISK